MSFVRRSRFWILLAALLIGFCGASAFALLELRRDSYEIATANAHNLLQVLSQDIESNLLNYDRILSGVARKLADGRLSELSEGMQQTYLFDDVLVAPYFTSLLVLDATGKVVRDAGALPARSDNFADREYFRAQRDKTVSGLYVSDPFRRRLTGNDAVIALSRRIDAADGSFAGVVVGTVRLDYFRTLFERADLHARDAINLLSGSGVMMMRTPYLEEQIGRDLSATPNIKRFIQEGSGTFSGVAAVDGVERVYTFSRVGTLPMIMNVALAEDDIYAGWRVRALQIAAVLAMLSILAIALGFFVRRELTKRTLAERKALLSETQYKLLADNASDIILRLDRDLTRQYVSPACRRILGYEPEELVGRTTRDLIHPEDWPIVEQMVAASRTQSELAEATYRLRHRMGQEIWVEGRYSFIPEEDSYFVVLRDISKRKVAEFELEKVHVRLQDLANKDGLTGLSNRRQFDETLAREWQKASIDARPLSLLLLDVDHFKRFNDTFGHQAGDECLRKVAVAIADCVRAHDAAARYGGEEFAVVLPGSDERAASAVAARIVAAVKKLGIAHPGNAEGGGVVTISAGYAMRYADVPIPVDPEDMIRLADAALYEAKRIGRDRAVAATEMPKNPLAPVLADEEARAVAVDRAVRALDRDRTDAFDVIARGAAEMMDAPIGFVSLVGSHDVVLIGRHGIEAESVPRDVAFCSHTVTGSEPLFVADLAKDPRFVGNPLVTGEDGLRSYMGAPFFDPTGNAIGAVCVVSSTPMQTQPTPDQRRSLIAMGRVAASRLQEPRAPATSRPHVE